MNKILLSKRTINALEIASKFAKGDRFIFRVNEEIMNGRMGAINESSNTLLQFLPTEDFSNIENFSLNNFKRFIGTLSLFDSPSLSIDTDSKYINISESDNASKNVTFPLAPDYYGTKGKFMNFSGDGSHLTIKITEDTWEIIHKLNRLYSIKGPENKTLLPNLTIVADNGIVSIRTGKNPEDNNCFKFDIGTCSKDKYLWNVIHSKNLLLLPKEECELNVYNCSLNRIFYPNTEYEFFISSECGSKFEKEGETNE